MNPSKKRIRSEAFVPAQGFSFSSNNDEFQINNGNRYMFFDNSRNSENITLPKTVRTLPNLVRYSNNQGNALPG